MPLAEAQALCQSAEATNSIFIERDDSRADSEHLRAVARLCERFTPLFGIETAMRPECLVLDVTGCTHLWRDAEGLLAAMAKELSEQGWLARLALAPTWGAAWAAAHFWASADQRPVLTQSSLSTDLARLPIRALRLSPRDLSLLPELGIRSIGQLQRLPRASLPSRFGSSLLQRLKQALGEEPELWERVEPRVPLVASWAGECPLTHDDELKCVCQELLARLLARLNERRAGVRQLLCRVRDPVGQTREWCVDFTVPVTAASYVLCMLALQWERTSLPEAIAAVHLEVTSSDIMQTRSRNLFGEPINGDEQRDLHGLLDRLSNRLGREAVLLAELQPEAPPERAVVYCPAIPGCTTSRTARFAQAETLAASRQRPCRLLAAPQPIAVSRVGPEGAPFSFRWNQREQRVICSWGPERLATGWWREAPVSRDYFRVETTSGSHFWLFLDLTAFQLFLHGFFD